MNPLNALNDIVLAEQVGWWPLAWGWWLTFVVLCALITTAIVCRMRYVQGRRVYRAAIAELAKHNHSLSTLNQVVKRAALQVWPAEDVSALQGDDWQRFLINSMPANEQAQFAEELQEFSQAVYQPSSQEQQQQYARLMERWLHLGLPKVAARKQKHV